MKDKYLIARRLSVALVSAGGLLLSTVLLWREPSFTTADIPAFALCVLLLNILPFLLSLSLPTLRLRICSHGVICLQSFCLCLACLIPLYIVVGGIMLREAGVGEYLINLLPPLSVLFSVFWNGMLSVYLASLQLGIKHRVQGLLLGLVPVANLLALRRIIRVVSSEVLTESEWCLRERSRAHLGLCDTKYPILFVHGVFFRDSRLLNYWGRIPAALESNGARVYYGNHESAASVADSGAFLAERISQIVESTGCEKVNIIAHSKGGLDCRYAIARCGAGDMVASLTTINTPHRGCRFADYLLEVLPRSLQEKVAKTYNNTMRRLGDKNPDFMAAVYDLRAASCAELDADLTVSRHIYTRSVGSLMPHATTGRFPLNFTYHIARFFDGPNDGLVSEDSFRFGTNYTLLTPTGERGISHGDMIDMNRENIPGFDVREFYIQLVNELKEMGF